MSKGKRKREEKERGDAYPTKEEWREERDEEKGDERGRRKGNGQTRHGPRGGGGGKKFPLPKLRHHFCLSKNDVI